VRRAYFSLGSNLGDRGQFLAMGVERVSAGEAHRVSRVYQSEPVGGVVQDDFWNLVLEVTSSSSARELLQRAHDAEAAAWRTREERWGPRTLDVDIVWIDGETHDAEDLTIPHPRMRERNFVLVPLRELRQDLVDEDALERAYGRVEILGRLESLH
jgi:2-amino-4-hydroxy-6-hydroxymethyldihydropteridine diphosphokinase